jgi:hypothetical protein
MYGKDSNIFHLQGILCDIHEDDRCNIFVASIRGTVNGKAVPITARGRLQGCETSKLDFLENRLTDGGEVVSLTCRPPFTAKKIYGTHFC